MSRFFFTWNNAIISAKAHEKQLLGEGDAFKITQWGEEKEKGQNEIGMSHGLFYSRSR